jgi:hypothetical protein
MPAHKDHYPTMIENPTTHKRVGVQTPLAHHRQLVAWGLPGLEPVPAAPAASPQPGPSHEPGYPKMIQDQHTGQRMRVEDKADHDAQLDRWDSAAQQVKSTTRPAAPLVPPVPGTPPPPPPPPAGKAPGKTAAATSRANKAAKGNGGVQPPTKEELVAKGYGPTLAERLADEEVRKANAGEAPYDNKG